MKNREIPIPQLWTEEIQLLTKVVSELPGRSNIVEIGTAQGGGFHLIASSRRDPKNTSLHSFDPYPGKALPSLVKTHKNTFSHSATSSQGAKAWRLKAQGRVNLLIVDGSHTLEAVHQDYTTWRKLLSNPCEVIFHDYDPIGRDGASHPAVKVLCDSLLSSGSETAIVKGREGRYLHIVLATAPPILLKHLQGSFRKWITDATMIARAFRSSEQRSADALMNQYASHSRLVPQLSPLPRGISRNSDLAFAIHAASTVGTIHEVLLDQTQDRASVLKWMEYLEMFLYARSWGQNCLLDTKKSPIIQTCNGCVNIRALSKLCADVAVLIGIVERLFMFLKK